MPLMLRKVESRNKPCEMPVTHQPQQSPQENPEFCHRLFISTDGTSSEVARGHWRMALKSMKMGQESHRISRSNYLVKSHWKKMIYSDLSHGDCRFPTSCASLTCSPPRKKRIYHFWNNNQKERQSRDGLMDWIWRQELHILFLLFQFAICFPCPNWRTSRREKKTKKIWLHNLQTPPFWTSQQWFKQLEAPMKDEMQNFFTCTEQKSKTDADRACLHSV